jgi:protein O-mannosyl-transferase
MSKRKKSFNNDKQARRARSGIVLTSLPRLRVLAGIAIIVLIAFLAYLPSINGGFVLDDNLLLGKNDLIRNPDGLRKLWCTNESEEYYPVSYSTLWIEWRLWGMTPTGYHVINLILHILESLLIWVILRKMSIPGAFLAALIFIVHPVNVESVAWIAQRRNVVAMLFFLLSILWYLKADIHTAVVGIAPARSYGGPWEREKTFSSFILHTSSFHLWYGLSLAAFMVAMLGKGSAVVLPVLLLGIAWWRRSLTRRDLVRIAPFFLLALVLTVVNIWFQTHGKDIEIRNAGFAERLLGAGGVVWFYLYKAIMPFDLEFIYPQWHIEMGNPMWWLPLLAAIIVTAVLWVYRKAWSRSLLFAWGFFCVSLVPVMGFTDVGFMKYSLVADHYQHIAIIGVIALAAAGWSIWHEQARNTPHWVITTVAVVVMGVLAFLTWLQSGLYHNAIRLYQATLQNNPGSWLAQNCLGYALDQEGRAPEAFEHYREALRLNPDFIEAHINLGVDLANAGRLPEAIEHFRQALRLDPDCVDAHNNLGNALANADRLPEAIEHYQEALRLNPDYANAHNNLGAALVDSGRLTEAIEHYRQALQLDPDYTDAHNNLGNALAKAGRLQEAIEHYQQALRLKPGYAYVYFNLALAYSRMKQSSEAVSAAEKGLELARSQGQQAQAEQIEMWLNSYRANLSNFPNASPSSESNRPVH